MVPARRLFAVGGPMPQCDLWRYSRRVVATHGDEAPQLRRTLFAHSLAIADDQHCAVASAPGHAGVLVPLFEDEGGQLHVLLTERAASLSAHAGEVAFPGGKTDPGETDLDAAVREAHEEVGLPSERLEVLGCLPAMLSKNGLVCCPFVALVDWAGFEPRLSPREVAGVFSVPVRWLMEPGNLRVRQFPAWTSFEWHFPVAGGRTQRVWGLTGGILLYLLMTAFRFAPEGAEGVETYLATRIAKARL